DKAETGLGALLVLEMADPFEAEALRIERDLVADGSFGVRQKRREAAAGGIEFHHEVAAIHVAIDRAFALLQLGPRDLRQWNESPRAGGEDEIADRLRAASRRYVEADRHVVVAVADEDLVHCSAADSGLDEIGDVRDVDAVSGCRFAIRGDRDLRQRR